MRNYKLTREMILGALSQTDYVYQPRKNAIKMGSNVSVSLDTLFDAYSYGWWKFVTVINNKVIFNDYSYSTSTNKHQSKVKSLMRALNLEIDATVYTRSSLPSSFDSIDLTETAEEYGKFHVLAKYSRTPRTWAVDRKEEILKSIKVVAKAKKLKASEIKEILAKGIEAAETDRRHKLDRMKAKRLALSKQTKPCGAHVGNDGFQSCDGNLNNCVPF